MSYDYSENVLVQDSAAAPITKRCSGKTGRWVEKTIMKLSCGVISGMHSKK